MLLTGLALVRHEELAMAASAEESVMWPRRLTEVEKLVAA